MSDEELVSMWQSEPPHPSAHLIAAELMQRYRRKVYRWCGRFVYDHDKALDMTQDVLLSAFENLNRVPEGARFAAWLFVITRNTCLGELRKMKVRKHDSFALNKLIDRGNTPEEDMLQRLDEDSFLKLLETTLSPLERQAISLRCFEKVPVDAVTAMLNIKTASGARGVLQSARRKLKIAMDRRVE